MSNAPTIFVVDSKGEVRITTEFLAGQEARAKLNEAVNTARDEVGNAASYVYDNGTKLASETGDFVAEKARQVYDFGRGFFS
jgi:hypothetical protein